MSKKIDDYRSLPGFETKQIPTFIKSYDEPQGIVKHFVAIIGNVDEGDDEIQSGAFRKTIFERGRRVKVLDMHQTDSVLRVLGKPLELREVGREELTPEVLEYAPDATGGLLATTQYALKTRAGNDVFELVRGGFLPESSIGYDAIEIDHEKRTMPDGTERVIRLLREIRLWEYSNVIFGMNPATTVTSAKSQPSERKPWGTFPVGDEFCVFRVDADGERVGEALGCHDTEAAARQQVEALYAAEPEAGSKGDGEPETAEEKTLADESGDETGEPEESKGVSGRTDWPLADRGRAWDNAAAEKRVRAWAGAEDGPNAKYRSCHFWYDAGNADNFTAYKLLFCDVVDGRAQAVPRGLFAVAAVLQGARGGTAIPAADQAKVKSRVAGYYARMQREFDDDSIVPPWEKSADAEHEGMTVARQAGTGELKFVWQGDGGEHHEITESEIRDMKEGRVLSTANAKRILSAVNALIEALESAGIDVNEHGKGRLPNEAASISSGTGPAAEEPPSIPGGTGPGQKTSDERLRLIETERERISIAMEV